MRVISISIHTNGYFFGDKIWGIFNEQRLDMISDLSTKFERLSAYIHIFNFGAIEISKLTIQCLFTRHDTLDIN